MAGRILGLLLLCDPPHRTASQLADELSASKGGISEMTRLLIGFGLVERFARPGERASYLRVRDDGFETLFEAEIRILDGFSPVADRGLALVEDERAGRSDAGARLKALRALFRFFEEAMPELLDRWRSEREERIAREG